MLLATILCRIIPMEGAIVGAFKGIRAAAALILPAALPSENSHQESLFHGVMLVAFVLVLFFNVNILLVIVGADAGVSLASICC